MSAPSSNNRPPGNRPPARRPVAVALKYEFGTQSLPKIVATGLVLFLLGPWMMGTMLDFMRAILIELPRFAH